MRQIVLSSILFLSAALVHADLPTGVQCRTFYDTAAIRYTEPVWFGEIPGRKGAFLVGELGGGIFRLDPGPTGYVSTLFCRLSPFYFSGNDGLLGLAVHPGFADNRKYYVYYNSRRGETVLEERTAAADSRSDAGTSRILMRLAFQNVVHNGGDMHFGPDGLLYLALGDAGNPLIYNSRSQDLTLLHGKMLRIDVDRKEPGLEYGIPADNPFAASGDAAIRKEIYAYGLRQPWRWSFDPADGRILLADVGDWVEEEVNVIRKGGNYGWSVREGNTCFNRDLETSPLASCDTAGLVAPVAVLPHTPVSTDPRASITGGYVFRGDPASPAYGVYVFGDYIDHKIYGLRLREGAPPEMGPIGLAPSAISAFGADGDGNLYLVGINSGVIYRLHHPDLQGKGLSIRPGASGSRPTPAIRSPRRSGSGWWIDSGLHPGLEDLRIMALDGRILRTAGGAEYRRGFRLLAPAGLYLARGKAGTGLRSFALLLK
jgi:hypothetical protein